MKSLEDLKKLRQQSLKKVEMRNGDKRYRVIVGMATCGIAAGARPVLNALVEESAKADYDCIITQTGCIGLCAYEPIVEVLDKDGTKTTYVHMSADKAIQVLHQHISQGKIVEEYTIQQAQGGR